MPPGTYTFSGVNKTSNTAFIYIDQMNADGSVAGFDYWIGGVATVPNRTKTLSAGQYFIVFDQQARNTSDTNKFDYFNLQIEVGSTASVFEEYHGQILPISWQTEAGTVYGGTLNVINGELMVTHGDADMGDLQYTRLESGGVSVFRNAIGALPVTDNTQHGITSIYPFAGTRFISSMPDKSWMIDSNGRFNVRDDSYSDAATFKVAMNGQTLVYELANPQAYQLDQNEINTLNGINNVYADTGDVAVTYIAKSARFSFGSPLHTYNHANLKLFGNTYIEHGKG